MRLTRPISLIDFVARFEPACASSDEEELAARWHKSACPRLVARVQELGYSGQDARCCTLEMLRQSATRLEMAQGACEALSYRLESGIRSILGRIALLRVNKELVRAESHDRPVPQATRRRIETTPVDAAHAVAACMSAVLCAGLGEGDPQVPYWWTFDAIVAAQLDGYARSALETFFAVVTLCRGGVMKCDAEQLGALLETAFAVLPLAIDAIIERSSAQGASEEAVRVWENIATYVSDPLLSLQLARDLRMARD
jgi:hypothetical protein